MNTGYLNVFHNAEVIAFNDQQLALKNVDHENLSHYLVKEEVSTDMKNAFFEKI